MVNEVTLDKPVDFQVKIDLEEDSVVSLTFDNGEYDYEPIKHPWLSLNYLSSRLTGVQKLLSDWADRYNLMLVDKDKDRLTLNGDLTEKMWLGLADWGWDLYQDLFDLKAEGRPELVGWSREIAENLPTGSRMVIDSTLCDLPWGLLYDAEPDINSEKFLEHFWGLKYQLEGVPFFVPQIAIKPKHILNNEAHTRLSVTINEQLDSECKTAHKLFFEALPHDFKFPLTSSISPPSTCHTVKGDITINTAKEGVINSLLERQEPQHLYYYFCHHEKGDGIFNYRGYRDFDESKMVITGKLPLPDTTIGFLELKQNGKIKKFKYPPVVFMNACGSAQVDSGNPAGFMFYFTYMLSASVFIGTEAPIPASFADDFGRCFIKRFLKGESVGQTLFDLIRHYALTHKNPFGLYYTIHGNGNTRLTKPLEEVSDVSSLRY